MLSLRRSGPLRLPIETSRNNIAYYRALSESGSQISLISEQSAQQPSLQRRHKTTTTITGIGGEKRHKGSTAVDINIRIKARRTLNVTAIVLPKLTNFVPSADAAVPKIPKEVYQNLADPLLSESRPIDIILGVDVFEQLVGFKKIAVSVEIHPLVLFCRGSLHSLIRQEWLLSTLRQISISNNSGNSRNYRNESH